MIQSPNTFIDPKNFPIKFTQKTPTKIFAFGESSFPVSFIFDSSPREAIFSGATASQLDVLFTDKNIYSSTSIVYYGLGESSHFELTASGKNISTTSFYLTTTKTDKSVSIVSAYKLIEIRQPLFSAGVPSVFSSNQSAKDFDGYIYDGATYYPSATMKLSIHKMTSSGHENLSNIYTAESTDTSIILADANSYGLIDIEVEVILNWYEDEDRTTTSAISPVINLPTFGIRMYISSGGKMSEKMIVSGNSCIATSLYPSSILKSLGGDSVDLAYWGSGKDGIGLFWGREIGIEVSTNGLAIQNGSETSTYVLSNQLLDNDFSSSSSSSSSSTSSNNSQSSESTFLKTSSTSSTSSDSSISSDTSSSSSSSSSSSTSNSSLSSVSSVSSTSSTALLDLDSESSVVYNYLRSSSSSLDASLLAKYSFSETPNVFGKVLDGSEYLRNLSIGTVSGGLGPPKWGSSFGISGGGFLFDADSSHCDYLQTMNMSGLSETKSIGFWFKPNGKGNTISVPFCLSNGYVSDSSKTEFALQVNSVNKQISSWIKINGTTKWAFNTANDSISIGSWNHIVVIHNGSRPYVYINGIMSILSYTVNTDKSIWISDLLSSGYKPDRLIIGGAPRYYSPFMAVGFSGQVDEIMIWDEALSASAVVDEYDKMEKLSSQSFSSQSTQSEGI